MNLLIIGGLFAVAILAIIGIIFLSLGERNAQAARQGSTQATPPPVARTARPTVPLTPTDHHETNTRSRMQEPGIQRRTFPRNDETTDVDHKEGSLIPMLNGQFHEFVDELRTLHQQAWELEHRLSSLTQMVERIERSQPHSVSIEEDDEETFRVEDAQE